MNEDARLGVEGETGRELEGGGGRLNAEDCIVGGGLVLDEDITAIGVFRAVPELCRDMEGCAIVLEVEDGRNEVEDKKEKSGSADCRRATDAGWENVG